MRPVRFRWIFCLCLAGWWSGGITAALAQAKTDPGRYGIQMSGYTRSIMCKQCHTAIYDIWSRSMHANAVNDPIFLTAYREAVEEGGQEAKRLCLSCHSPTTRHTEDYDLTLPLSHEGVTCDFCHTVSEVDLSRSPPFTHDLGPTKRGVHKRMSSPAHYTQASSVHSRSAFCGGCHDFTSPQGVPILETYSEWRASRYASLGIECQDCHMRPWKDMPIVNQDIKLTNTLAPDHTFPGGHAEVRLQDAATVILMTQRQGDTITADAWVKNIGAGHKLPTGAPTRRVTLTVSLLTSSGTLIESQQQVYQKVLEDDRGQPVTTVPASFSKATRVLEDNRLAPQELRKEQFTFKKPRRSGTFIVKALLNYQFETTVGTMDTKMSEDTCLVRLGPSLLGATVWGGIRIGLLGGIAWGLWSLFRRKT